MDKKIAVIGAGAWGTTLANLLAKKGYLVKLWCRRPELAEKIRETKENVDRLPGIKLSENIKPTSSLNEATEQEKIIVLAVPSKFLRTIFEELEFYLEHGIIIVNVSKGIEVRSLKLPHEIVTEKLKEIFSYATLGGPSFASEVARELPAAVSIASNESEISKQIQDIFATSYFRPYTNNDILGTELGGALKNVLAIAAGISDGLKLGHNTKAALITRGIQEMFRFGEIKGAKKETLMGLAGLGDLILTCNSNLSRNYTIGRKIAEDNKPLKLALEEIKGLPEGVETTKAVFNLANKLNIDMPITEQIFCVLYRNQKPKEALKSLMNRQTKNEY